MNLAIDNSSEMQSFIITGQRLTEIIHRIILTILITTFKIETIDKSSDRFDSISNYIYGDKSDMVVRISQRWTRDKHQNDINDDILYELYH